MAASIPASSASRHRIRRSPKAWVRSPTIPLSAWGRATGWSPAPVAACCAPPAHSRKTARSRRVSTIPRSTPMCAAAIFSQMRRSPGATRTNCSSAARCARWHKLRSSNRRRHPGEALAKAAPASVHFGWGWLFAEEALYRADGAAAEILQALADPFEIAAHGGATRFEDRDGVGRSLGQHCRHIGAISRIVPGPTDNDRHGDIAGKFEIEAIVDRMGAQIDGARPGQWDEPRGQTQIVIAHDAVRNRAGGAQRGKPGGIIPADNAADRGRGQRQRVDPFNAALGEEIEGTGYVKHPDQLALDPGGVVRESQ